ncbi:MAG: extracellular solute-binding protein [Actinomycetota bacterium]|nr:extracellular solute-binding protein [Actinomycetota bacterium]
MTDITKRVMTVPRGIFLVCIISTLLLVACGGDAGESRDAGEGDSSAPAYESREDLEAAAEEESGEFKVYMSTQEEAIAEIADGFAAKYPNLNVEITEQSGSDAQRILLEVQGGASDYDILYLSQEVYKDFLPHLEQIDLMAMAEAGIIDIPIEMINPDEPYSAAFGSGMASASYNPKLLDEALVPKAWEDYLKPELKGKFAVDIEPVNLATLVPAWGEDKVKEFAADIYEQDPIWARGETYALTTMAAGEFPLHFMSNYHSSYRAIQEAPDDLANVLIEPIPVRLTQAQGIQAGTENPASSVLFLEYLATPEVQEVFDELEPRQSSLYAEGSEVAKLTEGKELSLWGWEEFPKMQGYLDMILEAWGFPTAKLVDPED